MNFTHMAVGMFPESLVRLVVTVEWTPGQSDYAVTLHNDETGEVIGTYTNNWATLETTEPDASVLDIAVYHALKSVYTAAARLAGQVCGFGFTEWHAAAALPNSVKAKFGGAAA